MVRPWCEREIFQVTAESTPTFDQIDYTLDAANCALNEFRPKMKKPFILARTGKGYTADSLAEEVMKGLGVQSLNPEHQSVVKLTFDRTQFSRVLHEYAFDRFAEPEPEHEDLKGLTLYMDPSTEEVTYYCVTDDNRLSQQTGKFFISKMGWSYAEANATAKAARRVYLPQHPSGISVIDFEGEPLKCFNTYVPPLWREYEGPTEDRIPPQIDRLVNHLFPLAIERTYLYCWLRQSLIGRTETFLVLNGDPGIGKGTFKEIVRALHGKSNQSDLKVSTASDKFNRQLFGVTLVWGDEFMITEKTEATLKEWQNEWLSEERKGVDATKASRQYNNFVISNNYADHNFIHRESRKFAPLMMGNKRLEHVFTSEEITRDLKDPFRQDTDSFDVKLVAQFGRWLMKHATVPLNKEGRPIWNNFNYHGPKFHQLVQVSLRGWQSQIVQYLTEPEKRKNGNLLIESDDGYLWSSVQQAMNKGAKGGLRLPTVKFPKVRTFLEKYCDTAGNHVFACKEDPKSMVSDFYVKQVLTNFKMMTAEDIQSLIDISDDDEDIF